MVSELRRGYGSACLRGLAEVESFALSGTSPKVIVFLDADYSDHPELLPDLVRPILAGDADFVLGSRMLGVRESGAMPPQSLFGNRLACFLMRILFSSRYTDLGPFRAIDYAALKRLRMVDTNYGWTVEMQIKATRAGLRTIEIPVSLPDVEIGQSKISSTIMGSIKAGWKILFLIAKYGIQSPQKV